MKQKTIQKFGELLLSLKEVFLSQGELTDSNWGVYTEEIEELSVDTVCHVADLPEVTDSCEEIYPEGVPTAGGCITGELLNNCVSFCQMHDPNATVQELLSVVNYYLDNDCFPEMKDTIHQPEVILVQPITDKKMLLKIRKAFGLPQPMGELLKMAEHTPCLLTNTLSLAEARRIIAEHQLDAWVNVKL